MAYARSPRNPTRRPSPGESGGNTGGGGGGSSQPDYRGKTPEEYAKEMDNWRESQQPQPSTGGKTLVTDNPYTGVKTYKDDRGNLIIERSEPTQITPTQLRQKVIEEQKKRGLPVSNVVYYNNRYISIEEYSKKNPDLLKADSPSNISNIVATQIRDKNRQYQERAYLTAVQNRVKGQVAKQVTADLQESYKEQQKAFKLSENRREGYATRVQRELQRTGEIEFYADDKNTVSFLFKTEPESRLKRVPPQTPIEERGISRGSTALDFIPGYKEAKFMVVYNKGNEIISSGFQKKGLFQHKSIEESGSTALDFIPGYKEFSYGAGSTVYSEVREKPLLYAATIPAFGFGAGALTTRLSAVGVATATKVSIGTKILFGAYAIKKGREYYTAPDPQSKGAVIGKTGLEITSFMAGAYLGSTAVVSAGYLPQPAYYDPKLKVTNFKFQDLKGNSINAIKSLELQYYSPGKTPGSLIAKGYNIASFKNIPGNKNYELEFFTTPSLSSSDVKNLGYSSAVIDSPLQAKIIKKSSIGTAKSVTDLKLTSDVQVKEFVSNIKTTNKNPRQAYEQMIKTAEKSDLFYRPNVKYSDKTSRDIRSFKYKSNIDNTVYELNQLTTYTGKQAAINYGSSTIPPQVRKLYAKQIGSSGDKDALIFLSEPRVARFNRELIYNPQYGLRVRREPAFIDKSQPLLAQTKLKEANHLLDLHIPYGNEYSQPIAQSPFGYPLNQPTIKIDGGRNVRLSDAYLRYASSTFTVRTAEGNIYFSPEAHRLKDIGRGLITAKQLSEQSIGQEGGKGVIDIARQYKFYPKSALKNVMVEAPSMPSPSPSPRVYLTPISMPISPSPSYRLTSVSYAVSPSKSISPSRSPSISISPSPSPSRSPSISPSRSPSISPSKSPSISPSKSPSISISPSPSPSPSPSISPSPSPSPSPSISISPSPSPSPSPSISPSPTPQPKIVLGGLSFGRGNKKEGYRVLVRSKGVFKKISTAPTIKEAFIKGMDKVSNTASASFKIESVNNEKITYPSKQFLPHSRFYSSKREPGVFIQKRSFRISSAGEKREIPGKAKLINIQKSFIKNIFRR